ncbi:malto-oligosyltrehalose synthase [Rhizobium sp. TH2]|uniref:malto-oligosyltrehalose synthase n=1 Tax=Rhizobium sp. TH2 TaxID=2775403 RepID=UPI00215751BD|nr:malto-oligosyltrehalose synthase [Rhizobium sp. TH2]UVC06579.1 malto-oligosyltrehalose synthase [Rhizobium sp. TH2]
MVRNGPDDAPSAMPISTYRLQFRNGMTFDRAVGLIPHIKSLGVSHLYASPIFSAAAGSTHGYDVIDPNEMDPEIGGMKGFVRLSDALLGAGLGLILDIVPNHMAASLENRWWASVVKWGRASPYATFFDTDWDQQLTMPVLTGPIEDEIANGQGSITIDKSAGTVSFNYRGTYYPLDPATYASVFRSQDIRDAVEAISGKADSGDEIAFHDAFREILITHGTDHAPVGNAADICWLLNLQPWKLIHWREAANGLSYRRFFEVTGLVGLRVEDATVFDAAHQLTLDLVRQGRVQGLRIDHVDGLADPAAYLQHLRDKVGPDIYIVIEKILEGDETLPPDWPVAGTTGYEFIAALAGVFTDHESQTLDKAWAEVAPGFSEQEQELQKVKRLLADVNFRGETSALENWATRIATADRRENLTTDGKLSEAVRELVTGFRVYRTYGTDTGLSETDRHLLDEVFETLEARNPHLCDALSFLHDISSGKVSEAARTDAIRFRTRLQQLTGPVLAKSLEDTFFYRYNRLIALNEVGGDPIGREGDVTRFHASMQERLHTQPFALTTTSTHDTKRGEDARARLYTLSEAPENWVAAVRRWRGLHQRLVTLLPDGPAPGPADEWLIYQALAGVLPLNFDPNDEAYLTEIRDRFLPYLEKAFREAKLRTDWSDVNEPYEAAVKAYAGHLFSPENRAFLDDFRTVLAPYVATGIVNSLAQTLLKLTVPGVPDIYQGCEGFDFSLVDPDNRRIPNFVALAPPEGKPSINDPVALKSWLIAQTLKLRIRHRELFTFGEYIPIDVGGLRSDKILAFERRHAGISAIIAVPRLILDAVAGGKHLSRDYWDDTSLTIPAGVSHVSDAFGDGDETFGCDVPIARIFSRRPFALLMTPHH